MADKVAPLEAKRRLARLTDLFAANYAQYMSASYDESNTRTDFIDGFFEEALDWDVRNKEGASEVYRDVVRENKVKINGQAKAPDYSFRIGGMVKFYVEAKKPSVNIKDNPEPAYQVRRYAWTKKLPLSILTNMREFAVYDTRVKPAENDKASAARIFYCTFTEYERHLEFIYNTFSKQGIRSGSFDKYIEENKNKKGTSEVDAELLNMVEEWRMELAKNIALRNNDISIYNLNTVVQKIIDRIVFLRIAEDKGIENADLLKTIAQCKDVYTHLNQLFINANNKYNAGLFKTEEWIEKVQIDDVVLRNIIVNLYYPKSPYEFSVLPIEILGNIYEKFLGKTITFRGVKGKANGVRQHTAIIEEKPEVKKAGGVYYTPQYIVDYIVQNTVGVLIKDKTPEEIAALRFVDPACGSGSFLVGAYQYLLNYHLDYYTGEVNMKSALKKEKIYEASHGAYKLTIACKQKILQNNIYGVDIDSQAVEVTKLSLYLKLLENEGKEAEGQLFRFTDMKLLPSLENNIKCGNSLIGTDFYTPTLDFDEEMARKVNCFDWEKEFPEVFGNLTTKDTKGNKEKNLTAKDAKGEKDKGFDAVVGNPPYVSIRTSDFNNSYKGYFSTHYKLAKGQYDLYLLFTEKADKLLKATGSYGFIIPKRIISNENFEALRRFYLSNLHIKSYVDVGKAFADASVEANIIVCDKSDVSKSVSISTYDIQTSQIVHSHDVDKKAINTLPFSIFPFFIKQDMLKVVVKVREENRNTLGQACDIIRGFECGFNHPLITKGSGKYKIIKGEHIRRYEILPTVYSVTPDFEKQTRIFKMPEIFTKTPKLVTRFVSNILEFALDDVGYCNTNGVYNVHLKDNANLYYLLGVLNSKVTNFWFRNTYVNDDTIFPHIQKNQLESIPIPALDLTKPADKAAHDNLVALVDKMLELKRREHAEPNPQAKTVIERQIGAVDGQIDEAVYELYNLSDGEISII